MLSRKEQRELLEYIKVLGDENRLTMLALLRDEYRVGDLAAQLGISEPTTSHHLSRLREVGLVNLRVEGNQRIYRLNTSHLKRFKHLAQDIENADLSPAPANDLSWVDDLPLELSATDRKVFRDYTQQGRLMQIPVKQPKLMVILRWLATRFQPGVKYTEKEVNEIISAVHGDFATLRRELVNFGFIRRERAGTTYWLTPEDEQPA